MTEADEADAAGRPMADRGLTTPLQPLRPTGSRGPLALAVVALGVIVVLAWQPWGPVVPEPAAATVVSPAADSLASAAAVTPRLAGSADPVDPALFGGPTAGPWSGRVTGEWSVVAFLRPDPVSRDPLLLRQQQVAVFVQPYEPPGGPSTICDAEGTFLHRAAADLPTREVRFLGIAFPPGAGVVATRVVRVGTTLRTLPVELGRIPGVGASLPPMASTPSPSPSPAPEPVAMFALPGGGPWPDGVYRFEVASRTGLPGELFACIRP